MQVDQETKEEQTKDMVGVRFFKILKNMLYQH